jgi:hypothetical protein
MALRHRTDPPQGVEALTSPLMLAALEACDIPNPTVAEMRERDGSHVHF